MEILASAAVYLGLAATAFGALSVVRPLRWLGMRRRRTALLTAGAGLLLALGAMVLPVPSPRRSPPRALLDEVMPVSEFDERHSIRVQAPPRRVFRAVEDVTADEIRLFRALTWLRHPRWPWTEAPESILAPPRGRPILEVATRSGFVRLREERDRELVLGGIACCRPEDARRLLPRLRAGGAPAFTSLSDPGVATVAMSFQVQDDGDGWTRLSTETRVHATDHRSRRRFATYWRLIYPGSALIRRTWLRAIKARAERPASSSGG